MLKDKKICFIGTGNMGEALVSGLIQSGSSEPENIICTDAREDRLDYIRQTYGVVTLQDNLEAIEGAEIIIYAVKPQIIAPVLQETNKALDMTKLIISVAAGVPLEAIEELLKKDLRLIRVMPNVPAFVKAGATAIACGRHVLKDDLKLAHAIFDSVGASVYIPENYLMDAVTGLSGSGPAYVFLIVDALADAGVRVGLSRRDSLFLAIQTVLGAATLLKETQEHPGKLKDMVTSPGGTAIAGLHTLEEGGLRTTLINAVQAATERSKELGTLMMEKIRS